MLPSAIFFMLVGLRITHWDSIWSLQVLRCWMLLLHGKCMYINVHSPNYYREKCNNMNEVVHL